MTHTDDENGKHEAVDKPSSTAGRTTAAAAVPASEDGFDKQFAASVLNEWLRRNDQDPDLVQIKEVTAKSNGQQGLLSTTYLLDVKYTYQDEEAEKSLFVKVPLRGDAGATYRQVSVREHEMYKTVLPELQKFLAENCTGFFCLGVPELIYCHYEGDEVHDVVIIENLVAAGYQTCVTSDLKIENGGKDFLRSTLETLAQLHGTGLAYKKKVGGHKEILARFTNIEEQIQIEDIISTKEKRDFLRDHFSPFIRYIEEVDPDLKGITQYLRKMDTYLFKILKVLEQSGVGNLKTLCHGDAKPNNFMFRKIDLNFEDEDLKDLACEGVESMLIDWQGGFLGSLCNDLMWCVYPFLEVNGHDADFYNFAFAHYFQELKNVLDTFNSSMADQNLPENIADFKSLIKRGFVLEFLIVTVLRPVLNITEPKEVFKWYEKLKKYEKRKEKGGIHKLIAGKPPKLPPQDDVFQNPRYLEFLQFYFKIGTSLGAFQEMGLIYFELMKDAMFGDGAKDEYEEEVIKKAKPFTSDWLKTIVFGCGKSQTNENDTYEKKDREKEEKKKEQETSPLSGDNIIYADEEETRPKLTVEKETQNMKVVKDIDEELYEVVPKVTENEEPIKEVERAPTPPDPLRTLAAELHKSFVDYRETFSGVKSIFDNMAPVENDESENVKENVEDQNEQSDLKDSDKIDENKDDKECSVMKGTEKADDTTRNGSPAEKKAGKENEERINMDTPLTLRKISREVDYSNKKVQEAISFLTTNDQQSQEVTTERKRKISRQESNDTRKDSFCSNLSKQELMDILDEDEATWGQNETINEEPQQTSNNSDGAEKQCDSESKVNMVSDNKSSIMNWLSLSAKQEENVEHVIEESTKYSNDISTINKVQLEKSNVNAESMYKSVQKEKESLKQTDIAKTVNVDNKLLKSGSSIEQTINTDSEDIEELFRSEKSSKVETKTTCTTIIESVTDVVCKEDKKPKDLPENENSSSTNDEKSKDFVSHTESISVKNIKTESEVNSQCVNINKEENKFEEGKGSDSLTNSKSNFNKTSLSSNNGTVNDDNIYENKKDKKNKKKENLPQSNEDDLKAMKPDNNERGISEADNFKETKESCSIKENSECTSTEKTTAASETVNVKFIEEEDKMLTYIVDKRDNNDRNETSRFSNDSDKSMNNKSQNKKNKKNNKKEELPKSNDQELNDLKLEHEQTVSTDEKPSEFMEKKNTKIKKNNKKEDLPKSNNQEFNALELEHEQTVGTDEKPSEFMENDSKTDKHLINEISTTISSASETFKESHSQQSETVTSEVNMASKQTKLINQTKSESKHVTEKTENIIVKRRIIVNAVETKNLKNLEQSHLDEDDEMPSLVDSDPRSVDMDIACTKIEEQSAKILEKNDRTSKSSEIFDYIAENIDQPVSNIRKGPVTDPVATSNQMISETGLNIQNLDKRLSCLTLDEQDGLQNNVLLNETEFVSNMNNDKCETDLNTDNTKLKQNVKNGSDYNSAELKSKVINYLETLVQEKKDADTKFDVSTDKTDPLNGESDSTKTTEECISVNGEVRLADIEEHAVNGEDLSNGASNSDADGGKENERSERDSKEKTLPKSAGNTMKRRKNSQKKKRRKSKLYF